MQYAGRDQRTRYSRMRRIPAQTGTFDACIYLLRADVSKRASHDESVLLQSLRDAAARWRKSLAAARLGLEQVLVVNPVVSSEIGILSNEAFRQQ